MQRVLLPFAAAACIALLCAGPAAAGVIISEYVEGSSNNKAIELYNTGASAADLSAFTLRIYFNGNTTPAQSLLLTGLLAAGATRVIANPNAGATLLGLANQTFSGLTFNGDDAVVLEAAGNVVDSIGQVGVDPGSEWGLGLASTADNTLRRKPHILSGDTISSDVFDPSEQWIGFARDTFSGLGFHEVVAVPEPDTWLPMAVGVLALAGAQRLRRQARGHATA